MRIQIIVALIAFLLLRLSRAALDATVTPLTFATVVKANLMQRRSIRELLALPDEVPRWGGSEQGLLQWA